MIELSEKTTQLNRYDNSWFNPGGNAFKRICWYYFNIVFIKSYFFPFNGFKVSLLRLFGARIGIGVLIKPGVNIKYPWNLEVGDYCWIGEAVWIDNLAKITIGNNCCLSQGAMLLTGNHDYKNSAFDLIIGEIIIENGSWIGAKSMVCPGVNCGSHSVLSAMSVANKNLERYTIYAGNPAVAVRKREITL